jgi:hypothetical protein
MMLLLWEVQWLVPEVEGKRLQTKRSSESEAKWMYF